MCYSPGFISASRNLSCLTTICRLLPVIGRVSGGCWWLAKWASEAQSRVPCPVRVGWVLLYTIKMQTSFAVWYTIEMQTSFAVWLLVSTSRCPGVDMWDPNPWRYSLIGHVAPQSPTRGLNPWLRVLEATLHPMGLQPLTMDPRSSATPEGFQPLIKSSRSNSPTNCTLWRQWS
jgi:hypothetical protein